MHRIFLIEGRSASGKSTIVKEVAKRTNRRILKSYTTRPLRRDETEETSDHIHILPERVSNFQSNMVAYTERVGYVSFATLPQLFANDFYIINPSGEKQLKENVQRDDIRFITVYITSDNRRANAENRGDLDTWRINSMNEDAEFTEYEENMTADYVIHNDSTIDDAADQLIAIMKKEGVLR